MRSAELPTLFGRDVRRIHCVGVAGMGVGPLAIYLAQLGFAVSGEDDALTEEMRALLQRENVRLGGIADDCELVVYSSAIAKTHLAYVAASTRKLPLVRRGEMLAEVVREKKLVAVCGSHGKTTTTAMLVTALRRANFPAGYVLGGLFADDTPPARAGANEWVVAEIDESDGTIERFSPEIAVTVNLDWDHPDFYPRLADLEATFAALFQRTRGAVLVCDACEMSVETGSAGVPPAPNDEQAGRLRYFTFGRAGDFRAEIVAEDRERMTLRLGGKFAALEAQVRARGEFNASNATAALAAAQLMGAEISARTLADYPGVRRRQTVLHAGGGVTVLEDYAHHPAEIRALLSSLRRQLGARASLPRSENDADQRPALPGRLIVAFQPHRFSRTAQFKGEFAAALALADSVHLLDVYPAGEAPIAGGTTADIVAEMKRSAPVLPVSYWRGGDAEFFQALRRDVGASLRTGSGPGPAAEGADQWADQSGSTIVAFVGAGDIDRKAREWLASFRAVGAGGYAWDQLAAELKAVVSAGAKIKREEPLATKTTMRVGGAARVYAEPVSIEDLQGLLRAANARGIEVFILGRGSNLIVPDEGVNGLVISLAHEAWAKFEPRGQSRVWAGAGLRLKNLCGLAAKAGLVGFEFLEGIPGSVGGALRMNAGAMGGWMFDVVEEVQLMTLDGEVKTLARAEMHVDYRHCAELHRAIALGALLRPASQADADAIKRQMDAYAKKRHESQPREPSAGCIFKNPPGNSAGRLIDECGLKGERVGDAEVSTVHANFIVNRGSASGDDVLELVRRVRAKVRQAKGVELEPEVLLYGKKWEDVL